VCDVRRCDTLSSVLKTMTAEFGVGLKFVRFMQASLCLCSDAVGGRWRKALIALSVSMLMEQSR